MSLGLTLLVIAALVVVAALVMPLRDDNDDTDSASGEAEWGS